MGRCEGRVSRAKDMVGKTFAKLTVIERAENKGSHAQWLCKCECGREKTATTHNLLRGSTRSCGCLHVTSLTHGMSKERPYGIWRGMKQRCFRKKSKDYVRYGGRGIAVCEKWLTFEGFWEDMRVGYSDELTLERTDNNKNYEPSNCRWATNSEQQVNKRSNNLICINGVTKMLTEWSEITGISVGLIWYRQKYGKQGNDLIASPKKLKKPDSYSRKIEVMEGK